MSDKHSPVLLAESIEALSIKPGGVYIDGTFGRGGHSQAILNALDENGRLIAMDKDRQAFDFGKTLFKEEPRFSIYHTSFKNVMDICKQEGVMGKVDGILLDLGVSSPQLDDKERGFSFSQDGPLDMRMDTSQGISAKEWVSLAKESELVEVFKNYGEERYARRIAKGIVTERENKPIETTGQLAEIVKRYHPKWEKHKHPATRVFQAIRIFVNQELPDIEIFLERCMAVMAKGARLAVISFHSLEDKLVKKFMKEKARGKQLPREIPLMAEEFQPSFKLISKGIRPMENEVQVNIRARSAVLRIGEKLL